MADVPGRVSARPVVGARPAMPAWAALLALLVVVASTPSNAATSQFEAAFLPFATPGDAGSMAIGDLNADGKPDLVLATYSTKVSVLLGNGDGTFGDASPYFAGGVPNWVAIGDLNGDGIPDLAVANAWERGVTGDNVAVLLGNGDGSFGAPILHPTGASPTFVAICDVNGDGIQDLVATIPGASIGGGNAVAVLLGLGQGTFAPMTQHATGGSPRALAVGDLNGDGKLDLAVANSGPNTVSVLPGNGDGTFESQRDYPAGFTPWSVAIGDLDGDGKPDLAVANYNSNDMERP